jgi:glycosyltransferase involved in cell wall biosynthesis
MKINVTIPVFNEERRLADCIPQLHAFLEKHCRFDYEIVIANNGSTDRTQAVAEGLACWFANVRHRWIAEKGRGGALKTVWAESKAEVLSYMDVDLSSDLFAFPALIESVLGGRFDLAIGSRLLKTSSTTRGWKREIISRGYNRLIKALVGAGFSDAQCGFKAISATAACRLLPEVQDRAWFFDTELLVLAERRGYRIFELPVRWIDNRDSRVNVISTAWKDLQGLTRMRRRLKAPGTWFP